jgi:hypothetical protein
MSRLYRLPNRQITKSVQEYAKAWEDFASPLCDAFGWQLQGFDPNLQFATTDGCLFNLHVSAVLDLRAGLRTLHAHIASLNETNQVNRVAIMALKEMHAHATKPGP